MSNLRDFSGKNRVFNGITNTGTNTFSGTTNVSELLEDLVDITQTSNVITLDYTVGNVFFFTGTAFSANYTVAITNNPTTDGKIASYTFIHTQSSTGYRPTAISVNGTSITLNFLGAAAPTPTSSAGKVDIFTFTILRRSSTFTAYLTSALNIGT